MTSPQWLGGLRGRTRGMTSLRSLGGRRRTPGTATLQWPIRGMTSLQWLGGPRWRTRGTTRPRRPGGLPRRTRSTTRRRYPDGPRRRMTRGTGGPQRTMGMGGRRRTPGTATLRWQIRGMTSPTWPGGPRRIQGLAGQPRMIQGSGSQQHLAGQRPSTRDSACPRSPKPVSAAPPLPGRVQAAAAVRVRVTSGPLRVAATAAGIVVPVTRALLAARRPGSRLARLARGRHPLVWPTAPPLRRGKRRARKPSRVQNRSLPARLGRLRNASLPARLSRRKAPKRRAVGYRRECSRWPVPRPSWRELSPSS
jgi:hypothetical protein